MKTKLLNTGFIGLAAVSLALSSSCDKGASVDTKAIEATLKEIKADQQKIMAEIGSLKADVKKAATARPAKPARRPGTPDPSATYKVTVDDAYVKGPNDALITIVEWSDFQ